MATTRGSPTSTTSVPKMIRIKHVMVICLDQTNFFAWKSQFSYVVINFLSNVKSSVDELDDDTVKQDWLLLGWLMSTISTSMLPQVVDCSSSYDFWNSLQGMYNTKSKSRILHLRHQLQTIKQGLWRLAIIFLKLRKFQLGFARLWLSSMMRNSPCTHWAV